MAGRQTIAVDIDEVLMPHFQDLINWYNQNYGTHLTLADNHPKSTEGWGTDSFEEAVQRVHKFLLSDSFKKSMPFKEAKDAVRKLATDYRMVIITAREDIVKETTYRWLKTHFENLFDETHFTSAYSLQGKARHKADIAREIGADYLIDDSVEHIERAVETGIKGLLFGDYPWQDKKIIPSKAIRVKSWEEVLEYFDAAG
jgi:5'(3')-deoxyribonucleotidase